jgi:hypothetical protein
MSGGGGGADHHNSSSSVVWWPPPSPSLSTQERHSVDSASVRFAPSVLDQWDALDQGYRGCASSGGFERIWEHLNICNPYSVQRKKKRRLCLDIRRSMYAERRRRRQATPCHTPWPSLIPGSWDLVGCIDDWLAGHGCVFTYSHIPRNPDAKRRRVAEQMSHQLSAYLAAFQSASMPILVSRPDPVRGPDA